MKKALFQLKNQQWLENESNENFDTTFANLILCFAGKANLAEPQIYETVQKKFPKADIAFCSTAGEIYQNQVLDNSFIVAALQFEKTKIEATSVNIHDYSNTYTAAITLADRFKHQDLKYLMILSDGGLVNGSDLIKGLSSELPKAVLITGGLAGDGSNFESTLVGLNQQPKVGEIVAIGFYGSSLKVTHGSQGGWDFFGLEKRVTNSNGNILSEIEGQNALEIYKKYLGPEAANLPGSALLFPLSVIIPGTEQPVVRTILSINEQDKTMTFAGDIPIGSKVKFMKANFDHLISAASDAADIANSNNDAPDFSLLISCVGRKLILGNKIVEEVKAVSKTTAKKTLIAGFYSYGEISPFNEGGNCQLHNQTMTVTSFCEL